MPKILNADAETSSEARGATAVAPAPVIEQETISDTGKRVISESVTEAVEGTPLTLNKEDLALYRFYHPDGTYSDVYAALADHYRQKKGFYDMKPANWDQVRKDRSFNCDFCREAIFLDIPVPQGKMIGGELAEMGLVADLNNGAIKRLAALKHVHDVHRLEWQAMRFSGQLSEADVEAVEGRKGG